MVRSLTIENDEEEQLSFKVQCENLDLAPPKVLCKAAFFDIKGKAMNGDIPFDEFYVSAKGIHLTLEDPDYGIEMLKGSYDATNNKINWEDYRNDKFKFKEMVWEVSGAVHFIIVCVVKHSANLFALLSQSSNLFP